MYTYIDTRDILLLVHSSNTVDTLIDKRDILMNKNKKEIYIYIKKIYIKKEIYIYIDKRYI